MGSAARFAQIPNGSSYAVGIDPTKWTVSIAIAASIDPVVPLYVNTSTTFTNGSWLNKGKSGCGVSGNNAQKFLAASTQSVVYAGNP